MHLPMPVTKTFISLKEDVLNGQIKVPQFQRDFVWDIQTSSKLIDSILKGYPIGSFIFWRTNERLRSLRNIGGIDLPEPKSGEYVDYVLDGQQRLTSLIAVFLGELVTRLNGKNENFQNVYIDLCKDSQHEFEDAEIVFASNEEHGFPNYISVADLMQGDFELLASYPEYQRKKIKQYKSTIDTYQFSVIEIKDAKLDVATEIFTRINVNGKELSIFEVMVAKTYDPKKNFDLSEKYDELIECLREVNYETVSKSTVLQTVAALMTGSCSKKAILSLRKDEFIKHWDDVVEAIKAACDYLRGTFRIPVSELVPYGVLFVVFSYFFYKHKDKPTGIKAKMLEDFFWRAVVGKRYAAASENKTAVDIKKMDSILNGELPKYEWSVDTSTAHIMEHGEFSTGNSYIKGMLCLLAYQQPKSFGDNAIVNIGNDWLKQSNSKNYHHFFPKAFLKNRDVEDKKANHILNITIVDDFLNKREIRDKAPSDYMQNYLHNPKLKETMQTHLIGDFDLFGITMDDYDKFIERRANWFSEELEKRIIPAGADIGRVLQTV